jgi:hypothetical protein
MYLKIRLPATDNRIDHAFKKTTPESLLPPALFLSRKKVVPPSVTAYKYNRVFQYCKGVNN